MADQVLAGQPVEREAARSVLDSTDDELLDVLHAAFKVRAKYHGRKVKVHVLQNAKSGACPEDCGFCSQSSKFMTGVEAYATQGLSELLAGARRAAEAGASTYCMVTATRGPSNRDLQQVCEAVRAIRAEFPKLSVCTSLGLLKPEAARELKAAGVDRYNHNLETSSRYFDQVVSTHSYQDRIDTLRAAKDAGMEACAGGIVGMGEDKDDRVELALALRALDVESVPVNFLDPRPGTDLGKRRRLNGRDALRTLAMFRFVHPDRDVRAAGGREVCLGSLQPLALYPANSIFAEGYLTTGGQGQHRDWTMIREAGFEGEVVNA